MLTQTRLLQTVTKRVFVARPNHTINHPERVHFSPSLALATSIFHSSYIYKHTCSTCNTKKMMILLQFSVCTNAKSIFFCVSWKCVCSSTFTRNNKGTKVKPFQVERTILVIFCVWIVFTCVFSRDAIEQNLSTDNHYHYIWYLSRTSPLIPLWIVSPWVKQSHVKGYVSWFDAHHRVNFEFAVLLSIEWAIWRDERCKQ